MIVVRRRTGASAAGHDGGHRVAASLNGIVSLLLLLVAIAYVFDARSVDWFGRISFLDGPIMRGIGTAALVLAGNCLVWGEVSLGNSFRVALPDSKLTLVTHGIYRIMRNPLALSVDLLSLGLLLLAPSWLALVNLILNVVGYEWKIRIEEAYLREAHGATYAEYCRHTGRYFPRLSKRG
jgi:protein-S-isoprenylcysteine O-methyltransferase Ste14